MNLLKIYNQLTDRQRRELKRSNDLISAASTSAFRGIDFTQMSDHQISATLTTFMALANINDNINATDIPFIESWAHSSVNKRPSGVDINESRFLRLSRSTDWEEFYQSLKTGIKLVINRQSMINRQSIIDIMNLRADAWEHPDNYIGRKEFNFQLEILFYNHQK